VGERGRLGILQMGKSRHYRLPVLFGKGEKCLPQPDEKRELTDQIFSQSDTQTGGYLIIPRSSHMHPSARLFTHHGDQEGLDPCMNILILILEY